MSDELELDLGDEEITRKDNRIKSLSEKVKSTAEERDALAKAKEEEAARAAALEKERDFFKGFNTVSSKYPDAGAFQDKILELHNKGYSIEDAATSVLIKEGKFTAGPQMQAENATFTAAGGSAATGIANSAEKQFKDMSRDELRGALEESISKGQFNF